MRCGGDRGQSSLEYVGLLALVAIVLGAAVAAGAPAAAVDLGRTVTREWTRAFCLLRDGDCHRDREPCVVRVRRSEDGWSATIAFVDLGASWVGLLEQRSDGRWIVTRTRADDLGLSAGVGVKGGVSIRGLAVSAGGEARARALMGRGDTLTWTLPTRAAAERLLDRLTADRVASVSGSGLLRSIVDGAVDLPAPDERRREGRLALGGEASGEARAGGFGASFEVSGEDVVGEVRTDGGGRRTYVRVAGDAALALSGRGIEGGTEGAGELVVAVEHDRAGRPVDLSVVETHELDGTARLAADLSPVAGRLAPAGEAGEGRRRVMTAERHLDLTVARHREAARSLLDALAGGHSAIAVARALGLRGLLERAGTAEVRTYDTEVAELAAEAAGKLGVGLAVEAHHRVMSSRLVGALSRGLDGQWVARDDCLRRV